MATETQTTALVREPLESDGVVWLSLSDCRRPWSNWAKKHTIPKLANDKHLFLETRLRRYQKEQRKVYFHTSSCWKPASIVKHRHTPELLWRLQNPKNPRDYTSVTTEEAAQGSSRQPNATNAKYCKSTKPLGRTRLATRGSLGLAILSSMGGHRDIFLLCICIYDIIWLYMFRNCDWEFGISDLWVSSCNLEAFFLNFGAQKKHLNSSLEVHPTFRFNLKTIRKAAVFRERHCLAMPNVTYAKYDFEIFWELGTSNPWISSAFRCNQIGTLPEWISIKLEPFLVSTLPCISETIQCTVYFFWHQSTCNLSATNLNS